jgi:hypothetical protein
LRFCIRPLNGTFAFLAIMDIRARPIFRPLSAANLLGHVRPGDFWRACPYWGLLGARNWELIQPFKRVFSTWTQSPSRLVAVNCVPTEAVPRTGAVKDGADLMFTPGRCKKTRSSALCPAEVVWDVTAVGAAWGEAPAARGAGTSGEGATPDPPRDGLGTVGAGCTGVSDGAAWTEVADDDCTAMGEGSAVSMGAFPPGEARKRKKYASAAAPSAATIAVPAISFGRDPNVSDKLLGPG